MKLWNKGEKIDELFQRFTIGNDPDLDQRLIKHDIIASRAHVEMLEKVGLLTSNEKEDLVTALDQILKDVVEETRSVREGLEDCHSEIELRLTEMLGDTGKKVHSGRSRNDQVLVATKLYVKEELEKIAVLVKDLFELLIVRSKKYEKVLMPGYTHMQVAMPSSFGLWFGAYAESVSDDLLAIKYAYESADTNPLGSAAGYGSSFPLDRQYTTERLGFSRLNVNSVYAQMTRGKTEKVTTTAIAQLAGTISKLASDVCLYSGQNFNFFKLDKAFTTGSSIMPHKYNPDGFELLRAKCNKLQGLPFAINQVLTNLQTGYHRDLQILKESLIIGFEDIQDCLSLLLAMLENLAVNDDLIFEEKYDLLFTVERVNEKVVSGVPFRDAYREVADEIKNGTYTPRRDIKHEHIGSIGDPGHDLIENRFNEVYTFFEEKASRL